MEKIYQRRTHDCGVACLAMLAGVSYEKAEQAFVECGLDVKRRRAPFASNFADLIEVAKKLELTLTMRRFKSWADINSAVIVKVSAKHKRNWHWVVANPGPNGIEILDPGIDLPSFENPPLDVLIVQFSRYTPIGCILQT